MCRCDLERDRVDVGKGKEQVTEPLGLYLLRRHGIALAVADIPRLVVANGTTSCGAAVGGARRRVNDLAASVACLAGERVVEGICIEAVNSSCLCCEVVGPS